jgi:hypothetical protein
VRVFSSLALSVGFTVVFTVTGVYALVRFAALVSGAGGVDRTVELFHLLMSIAMIAMAWAWSGGPETASGILQIVVFGLFALWLLDGLVRATGGHPRLTSAHHLVTAIAMIWMVATTPVFMETMSGTATMASMPDMAMTGHAGSAMPGMVGMADAPVWARIVDIALVLLLAAGALMWGSRAVGRPDARPIASGPIGASTPPPGRGPAHASSARGVTTRHAPALLVWASGPRVDAGCHLLMSLGMAAMLLAML